MTKYFIAEITIERSLNLNIAAENEESARIQAREITQKNGMDGSITKIVIIPDGESEYEIGQRVVHKIFGEGNILNLEITSNFKGQRGYRATINFDNNGIKNIHLPLAKDILQIIRD